MHLTGRKPRAMAVATKWADGSDILEYQPRARAIQWLAEKIADDDAGLDPWDTTILIVEADQHELVWGYRCVELCGRVLDITQHPDGGRRFRAVIEADVRIELHLDRHDAPLMGDEPLASRAVDHAGAIMDAVFGVLPDARPLLFSVPLEAEDEPAYLPALREAKAAYDRRNADENQEAS